VANFYDALVDDRAPMVRIQPGHSQTATPG
jgi:hypothetical protein